MKTGVECRIKKESSWKHFKDQIEEPREDATYKDIRSIAISQIFEPKKQGDNPLVFSSILKNDCETPGMNKRRLQNSRRQALRKKENEESPKRLRKIETKAETNQEHQKKGRPSKGVKPLMEKKFLGDRLSRSQLDTLEIPSDPKWFCKESSEEESKEGERKAKVGAERLKESEVIEQNYSFSPFLESLKALKEASKQESPFSMDGRDNTKEKEELERIQEVLESKKVENDRVFKGLSKMRNWELKREFFTLEADLETAKNELDTQLILLSQIPGFEQISDDLLELAPEEEEPQGKNKALEMLWELENRLEKEIEFRNLSIAMSEQEKKNAQMNREAQKSRGKYVEKPKEEKNMWQTHQKNEEKGLRLIKIKTSRKNNPQNGTKKSNNTKNNFNTLNEFTQGTSLSQELAESPLIQGSRPSPFGYPECIENGVSHEQKRPETRVGSKRGSRKQVNGDTAPGEGLLISEFDAFTMPQGSSKKRLDSDPSQGKRCVDQGSVLENSGNSDMGRQQSPGAIIKRKSSMERRFIISQGRSSSANRKANYNESSSELSTTINNSSFDMKRVLAPLRNPMRGSNLHSVLQTSIAFSQLVPQNEDP